MASREDISERVKIMQAWLDGEEVEFEKPDGMVRHLGANVEFNFDRYKYRIRPNPRAIWQSNCGRRLNEAISPTGCNWCEVGGVIYYKYLEVLGEG